MSAYKDGNKFAPNMEPQEGGEQYVCSIYDVQPKVPASRAGKALFEGACLEEGTDPERVAEYEKNWKEGQKV